MNITIKITHSNGTVMEVSIPVLTPEIVPSTVVTPDEPQAAPETGNPVAGGLVDTFCNEVTKVEGKEIVREVPAEVADTSEQFKCTDGFYSIPPALYSDFAAAFGAPTVERELTKARLWCETNQQNRKTRRGMGRFLNAWLCRAQGEKRTPVKARSGSLLDGCNNTAQGW
jgi:hypothetical protein